MQVLPQVGHTVHEDSPDRVAEVLATFLVRNKLWTATDTFIPTFPSVLKIILSHGATVNAD